MPVGDAWVLQFGQDASLLHNAQAAFSTDRPRKIAVAVSGGSDSLASLHLMARVSAQEGWECRAVTVDHGLRAEAADEARFVGQICAELGVAHAVLRWEHDAVAGNLMDAARRARYALMAEWAAGQGIRHIVLGHTADDQAETFLMGLARGAGLDGLVGMRRQWEEGGVRFVRPFLLQERADLRAYLQRQGIEWIEDPSNANDRFTRVKARKALKALKPLGITVDRLSGVVTNLTLALGAVRAAVSEAEARICREDAGSVVFDRRAYHREGPEVARRLLIAALRWVSGAEYVPRAEAVTRVQEAIRAGKDTTLWGCRIRVSEAAFRVVREPKAIAGLICNPDQIWDGRWQLDGPAQPGQEVRALGTVGLRQCKGWRESAHHRDALVVSPAIWYGETLIAAPMAGFEAGWSARIVAGFSLFVVSH